MKELVIVGTGAFGQIAKEYFSEYTTFRCVSFAAEEKFINSNDFDGIKLISLDELYIKFPPGSVYIFVAIGYSKSNQVRQRIYEDLKLRGYEFASFIAPDVKIWSTNRIGQNVFVFENNVIQPYVALGDNTVLWSGNHIGHHSIIGDNCFISSHCVISGSCEIGNNSFIGVNSTIFDGVKIGKFNIISGGALITKPSKDGDVFVQQRTKLFPKKSFSIDF